MEDPGLSTAMPANEALTAERYLRHALAEEQARLKSLRQFAEENAALVRLVQELPQKVAHSVMVPLGGAAFFPGRLVHTNELTVLLGEGVYALRSATQAAELLERRAEFLNAKVEALEARVEDLQAEAAFARGAAEDAAAGVVEIKEDYEEGMAWARKAAVGAGSAPAPKPAADEDDGEHERIMARLEELERAEAAHGATAGEQEAAEEAGEGRPTSGALLQGGGAWEGEDAEEGDADTWRPAGRAADLGRKIIEVLPEGGSGRAASPGRAEAKARARLGTGGTAEPGAWLKAAQQRKVHFEGEEEPPKGTSEGGLRPGGGGGEPPKSAARGAPALPAVAAVPSQPSPAQQRAFPGAVVERAPSEPRAVAASSHVGKAPPKAGGEVPARPVSRFKQRLSGSG